MNTAARPQHHPSAQPAGIEPHLRAQWSALTAPTDPAVEFTADMAADLPAPTRRWLIRAIAPGTPLRRAAIVRQHGQIRIGGWHDYEADWALSPLTGFIWSATTHLGPITISGYDRYTRGSGEMRWRLFGLLPFMTATGTDVTRRRLQVLQAAVGGTQEHKRGLHPVTSDPLASGYAPGRKH